MSLIIDALKKAQQLRLKEEKAVPSFKNQKPYGLKKRRWPLILIVSAIFIFILSFLSFKYSYNIPQISSNIPQKEETPTITERPSNDMFSEPQGEAFNVEDEVNPRETIKETPKLNKVVSKLPAEKNKMESVIEENTLHSSNLEKDITPRVENNVSSSFDKLEKNVSLKLEIKDEIKKDISFEKEVVNQFNLALSLHKQKSFSEAIMAYQKVIEMDPNYFEAYNNLGLIYLEIGDLERSLKNYEKAIEINPKYDKSLNNIGIIYHLKGDDERAMEFFKRVVELNPNNIEGYVHLGILYRKNREWEKGIESYRKALSIQPKNREAHYNLGILYENMGNKDMAIYHYQQFIQIAEKDYPDFANKVSRHLRTLMGME